MTNLNEYSDARIFSETGNESQIPLLATPEQLADAYAAGQPVDGTARKVRGRLQALSLMDRAERHPAMRDLGHKQVVFVPDPVGLLYYAEPYFDETGALADLVVDAGGFDEAGRCVSLAGFGDFFWARGVADAFGKPSLSKPTTAEAPLMVYVDPETWRADGRTGFAILKESARRLIPQEAHIQFLSWYFLDDWDFKRFPFNDAQMQGPQDVEAYAAWVEDKVLEKTGWKRERWVGIKIPSFHELPPCADEYDDSVRPDWWPGPIFPGKVAGEAK